MKCIIGKTELSIIVFTGVWNYVETDPEIWEGNIEKNRAILAFKDFEINLRRNKHSHFGVRQIC